MGIHIKLDGREKELEPGIKIIDALKEMDRKLAKAAIGVKIDGAVLDLSHSLQADANIEVLTGDTPEGLDILRHSTSHVMAAAVKRLFPGVQVTIGPSIESGFYYDFDKDEPFVPEDLARIEKEMARIVKDNVPFVREELPVKEAIGKFKAMGEKYKVEIIEDLVKDGPVEKVSLYTCGDFTDLCRGPHVPSTAKIRAFKLLDVAGAYWRGDEKNRMLQRIYGTAFNSEEELKTHLENLEEAKRRDHRRLGKELDLFSFHEEGGPGLVYWHPKGALIRYIMEDFWRREHLKRGYQFCITPHIARSVLWEISGHLGFYKENMYSPIDIDGQEYILKPMNCPFHILIYKTRKRSYRELPLRWAELGTVYRYERSGVLHGLLRVRGFTQDDAHIFCTPDQLKGEMIKTVNFAIYMVKSMGFENMDIFLSTRPEKFSGTPEEWDRAEETLKTALDEEGLPYQVDEGGAVFYGPKIDIKLRDALGRHWQGPTIQFDFNEPRRFGVTYIGADGGEHQCVMVHRALWGSLERFFGCMVEHYGGAFPLWLSPVQAIILPIADRHSEFAQKTAEMLQERDFRVEVDLRREKVGFKIREAQVQKIPYMLVIGDQEMESGKLSVRERKAGDLGAMDVYRLMDVMKERIADRT
jgi:threonyl-tRNA synthetase